ncbi:MICOS complex subunit MIC27 [Thalassophryne amazonica]|uniref:MICOS complex subunit MIC27 n=1 Tax=Thalassophryne amazonica TaxID=390379 RepID=UPI0014719EBB|nr:MICOS complex subunit MIC27 [Thalassophryne amazonica]
MAAKVVMVAVPTVLGIASIRVHTGSDTHTGHISQQKLNVYTPLPPFSQAHFISENSGIIEHGVTTVREALLPLVQTVKGACVSMKQGSVNLYHAGEDVYYYLKYPPADFLPRFCTITVTGLLGMFLARRGGRFKGVAMPLGLMSVGAAVCYPAQVVTVLKVTGKKVYAAGQWTSSAVSLLLSSKPKELPAPQPQSAVPVEVSVAEAAHSSTLEDTPIFPETEVAPAGVLPISDELVPSVLSDEASSATLTEESFDHPLTQTTAVNSVEAETDALHPPEPSPVSPAKEELSASAQDSQDVSSNSRPSEPTSSLQPNTLQCDESPAPKPSIQPAGITNLQQKTALYLLHPIKGHEGTGAYFGGHWAKGGVHPAQAQSLPGPRQLTNSFMPIQCFGISHNAPGGHLLFPECSAVPSAVPVEVSVAEAAHSSTLEDTPIFPETEVAPAGVLPISDELVPSVLSDEASSATLTEESFDHPLTQTTAVNSVEAETDALHPPEPSPVSPAKEELSASAQDSQDVSSNSRPSEPTSSLQPNTLQCDESPAPKPSIQPADGVVKPDPTLMDFGQSTAEDEDLYSTHS